jgi:hypothetical protein
MFVCASFAATIPVSTQFRQSDSLARAGAHYSSVISMMCSGCNSHGCHLAALSQGTITSKQGTTMFARRVVNSLSS